MSVLERIFSNLIDGVVLGFKLPLRHVSGLFGRKYHMATIRGVGEIRVRPTCSDAKTFIDVFRRREYDLSNFGQFSSVIASYNHILESGQTPIIIDAGANVGAASIWFARQFPLARVLAVEPDPANAELCRMNTCSLRNVQVVQSAIGSVQGVVTLSNPKNQACAVQTTRSDEGNISVLTIPELSSHVKNPAKIFIVKIDIEGFESDLFSKNLEWVSEAEVIIIEPHDWVFPGKGTSGNFQKALAGLGFEILISGENLLYVRSRQGLS